MDERERARLVERHVDIPRKAAAMYWTRVKGYIEFDEIVSMGNTGLVQASHRYKEGASASFATFAWYRVQGAILDGLRKASVVPRREWAKVRAMINAGDYLEVQGERDRGAANAGVAPAKSADALRAMRDAMSAVRTMYKVSLDEMTERNEPHDEARPADDALDIARLSKRLAAAIEELPERERRLIKLCYSEGKTITEAGEALGLSKSWASRLHAQVIDRLRDATAPP